MYKTVNIFIVGFKVNTVQLRFVLKYRNMDGQCNKEDNLVLEINQQIVF